MYRRNRYYDPQTGRFTQEDPIGIAGGLNVYGYAVGDPVSYSDPYGLCPPLPDCIDPSKTDVTESTIQRYKKGDYIRVRAPVQIGGTSAIDIRFVDESAIARGVNEYGHDVVLFEGKAHIDFPEAIGEDARWIAQAAGDVMALKRGAVNLYDGSFEAVGSSIGGRGLGLSFFIKGNIYTGAYRGQACVAIVCGNFP